MQDKLYPFGAWVYNPLSDFTPDEVDTWKEFGLTVTMTPAVRYGTDEIKELIPYFENADKAGIKLIANVSGLTFYDYPGLGEEEYRKRFIEVYSLYKDHPSLYGFFIGDEPSGPVGLDAALQSTRIQMEIAPELDPYVDFSLNAFMHDRVFDTDAAESWMKKYVAESGIRKICFETYSATINKEAISAQIDDQRKMVEAITAAGAEPWVTLLCSSHLYYHIPSEYEQCMQLNSAAAGGCRGILWFRMYDRDIAPDYHGSPVDEFGGKTEHYYRLMRCMRRFNLHFGELFMTLRKKAAFHVGKRDGGYPEFTEGSHDVVTSIKCLDDLLVSFLEAPDGKEYMAVVNLAIEYNYTEVIIRSDSSKGRLFKVILNGRNETLLGTGATADGEFLYPGQMTLYRIERGDFSAEKRTHHRS